MDGLREPSLLLKTRKTSDWIPNASGKKSDTASHSPPRHQYATDEGVSDVLADHWRIGDLIDLGVPANGQGKKHAVARGCMFQNSGSVHPKNEPLSLRPKDAAKMLGIGQRKLWGLTQPRGPIPCVRVGTSVLYPVHLLKRWLDQAATQGDGECAG